MANYLVSCVIGFIAYHVTGMLIADGHVMVGVDNVSNSSDVRMKEYPLKGLQALPGFYYQYLDISVKSTIKAVEQLVSNSHVVIKLVNGYLQERTWVKDIATP